MKDILLMRRKLTVLFIVLLAVVLYGCGGGDNDNALSYSGTTQMAVIRADNAVELTLGAYYGGPVSIKIPIVRTAQGSAEESPASLQQEILSYALVSSKVIEKIASDSNELEQQRTIVTETEVVEGSCGGSETFTLHVDDTSGDFTGTIWNDNYCQEGVTSSGSISVSGRVDLNSLEITAMTMVFDLWDLSSSSYAITFSGQIDLAFTANMQVMTLNYLLRNNDSGKVYKVENYVTSTSLLLDRIEITVSDGRYYDPDHGYVDLISEQPVVQYIGSFVPSSGQLSITGAMQTKALLTLYSVSGIDIEIEISADTDGDGIFEWSSGILN